MKAAILRHSFITLLSSYRDDTLMARSTDDATNEQRENERRKLRANF